MLISLAKLRKRCDPRTMTTLLALSIALLCSEPFAQIPQTPIDAPQIRATVDALIAVIEREYFDAAVAKQAGSVVRQAAEVGTYAGVRSAEELAALLTRDLYGATCDKHLSVSVVRDVPKPDVTAPQVNADEARALDVRRSNAGVRKIEILPGNIGYLDVSFFYRPEEARERLIHTMQLLRDADAMILDMRGNGGGSPGTIAFLMSYFFDEPALSLFDIVHRPPETTEHYATESTAVADRNSQRPTFVLTAKATFSGGEGLAFLLQERRRAEVIGENTAGAANPGRAYPVNERFDVTVPNGQIKSAIKKSNWEGGGVAPDISAPADKSLNVAYARALRVLIDKQPAGPWRNELQEILRRVETVP